MDSREAEKILLDLAKVFMQEKLAASAGESAAAFLIPEPSADKGQGDARYRALVEQLPAVIFMAHLEEGISEAYVSPHIERVLGFTGDEWLKDPVLWYRQIHPEDKQRWNLEAAQMLVTGEPLRSVYRVLGRDGRVVWLHCQAKMLRAPDGHPRMIHGIAVDVTELKKAQAELEHAHGELKRRAFELEAAYRVLEEQIQRREEAELRLQESERLAAVGATAAVFAHEIGNPLNGISTSLQLLERRLAKYHDDPEIAGEVRQIVREIQRLGTLLQDFRFLARPKRLDLEPVSLPELVAEVMNTEAPLYQALGVRVERRFPVDFPLILGDRQRLKQVILNLCKNAVEAMPGGGSLVLEGVAEGGRAILRVTDTGVGIPEDFDVFELFKTSKPNGTGLGLAIVRQIVSAHEGTVEYASEPGKGTTFTVTLPLKAAGASPSAESGGEFHGRERSEPRAQPDSRPR
jgi:PAS domain S-box-containing protein